MARAGALLVGETPAVVAHLSHRQVPIRASLAWVRLRLYAVSVLGKSGSRTTMLLPVVAVDIAPSDPPAAMAEALLAACTSALRRGTCRATSAVASNEETPTTAVIVWDEADASVRVVVEVRRGADPRVMERRLSFADGDARIERWRAAGLTVASLVGEVGEQERVSAEAESAAGTSEEDDSGSELSLLSHRASSASLAFSGRQAWIGLAASLAPGATTESARLGGRMEAGFALSAPVYGLAAFDYAFGAGGSRDLETRWMTLRAGGLYASQLSSIGADAEWGVSAELLAQRVEASAVALEGSESGFRWDPGVALGVRGGWRASSLWSFSAGLDFWRLWRDTAIVLRDEEVARSSAWGGSVWLGIQWEPFGRKSHL